MLRSSHVPFSANMVFRGLGCDGCSIIATYWVATGFALTRIKRHTGIFRDFEESVEWQTLFSAYFKAIEIGFDHAVLFVSCF